MKKLLLIVFIAITLLFNLSSSCLAQELNESFKAGVIEYRSGNYKKTINIMDKLIQIEPDNYYAHYYLAISLVKLSKFDEARNHYEIVINNSDDEKIVSYSKVGIEKLASEQMAKQIEIIEVDKPDTTQITAQTAEEINNYSENIDESINNQYNNQDNNYQNTLVEEIAKKNNINPNELNNLIRLLANNPGAMQTLNKLASNNQGNNNSINNMDPKSIAKLIKMMTLNSQMGLLSSMTKNDDSNKKDNSMDMFSMMMGQNNPMANQMQAMQGMQGNGNNDMQALMNYMNGNNGQNNFNPDMMNMMLNNNMMNGFSSGF